MSALHALPPLWATGTEARRAACAAQEAATLAKAATAAAATATMAATTKVDGGSGTPEWSRA